MQVNSMDEVWKLVYDSFEQGSRGAWQTVAASNTMRNEVQFRLQKSISSYKHAPSKDLLRTIEADIQLCGSLGFFTQETTQKILTLLDHL